ncbi:MAG: hypothetical protein ACD_4C00108G0003 [uncultured bacterium (gcode 4)]|uniref:Uncharacterized protein n=1 Tax=uncultured bacterium (gcode 4) TaxID=1234023 RepID=K2G9W0_9BACT|nr:MAG: hypothetical protein ACD_4C00108G0003 [uncultured bacterium (gcode 4)]
MSQINSFEKFWEFQLSPKEQQDKQRKAWEQHEVIILWYKKANQLYQKHLWVEKTNKDQFHKEYIELSKNWENLAYEDLKKVWSLKPKTVSGKNESLSELYRKREQSFDEGELKFGDIQNSWDVMRFIKANLNNWMRNIEEGIWNPDNLAKLSILTSFATANEIGKFSFEFLSLWERINIACENFANWNLKEWEKVLEILKTIWVEWLKVLSIIPEWKVIEWVKLVSWKALAEKLWMALNKLDLAKMNKVLWERWSIIIKEWKILKDKRLFFDKLTPWKQEVLVKTNFWLWSSLEKITESLRINDRIKLNQEIWKSLNRTELLTDYVRIEELNNDTLKTINKWLENLNRILENKNVMTIIKSDSVKYSLWKDILFDLKMEIAKINNNLWNLHIERLSERKLDFNTQKFDNNWNNLITNFQE